MKYYFAIDEKQLIVQENQRDLLETFKLWKYSIMKFKKEWLQKKK